MANEFNADEFCQGMQQKAKELANVKKQVGKQRTKNGTVTLIVNGKRITHELPCDVKNCETCVVIDDIQFKIDHMMLEMRANLFDIFGDFF
jgi:hypothetical protein